MTDDDLVVRARSDRIAFGALYDRYYPRVMRYCLRRLFVRQVAEDVASDAFLQVASHLPAFEGTTDTDFRCWLYRIVSNAINAYLRQTRRRQELCESAARSGRLHTRHDVPTVEHLDWPAVYQAVLELDHRDQTILTLRYYADLPHDEIATIVGLKPGAVRTAMSRILERLRARFETDKSVTPLTEGQP
jgi:RNA polymerase sigma-70 factor (ECF subfamily)